MNEHPNLLSSAGLFRRHPSERRHPKTHSVLVQLGHMILHIPKVRLPRELVQMQTVSLASECGDVVFLRRERVKR